MDTIGWEDTEDLDEEEEIEDLEEENLIRQKL